MKWYAALAGVLVLMSSGFFHVSVAAADVRITEDSGGAVTAYIRKYQAMRAAGDRIVIDGPCLSSCTLFTGIIPRNRVCITSRAELGFHAASYYDDASRSLVPTQSGSRLVMRIYPPDIRAWIGEHGGLTPQLLMMRGQDLAAMFPACR